MEKFKISDIQDLFTADVERFHSLTQAHVANLLTQTPPPQESLDEALRHAHTLKGLAGTVEAWGLAGLGADYERLLELAGSWMQSEPARANGVFEFIRDHAEDWFMMNQYTCMDMLPQAWDLYQGLRNSMEEHWPACLPAVKGATDAETRFVRLADLELDDLTPALKPESQQSAVESPATKLEPPPVDSLPVPELDVQAAQPTASLPPAPTPPRVVPPTLRSISAESGAVSQQTEPATAPEAPINRDTLPDALIAHQEQLATPKPLQVVPPALRRKDGTPVESSGPPHEIASPVKASLSVEIPPATPAAGVVATSAPQTADTATTAPPLLRVAPPTLKRRVKKPLAGVAPVAASVSTPEPAPAAPPPVVEVRPPAEHVTAATAEQPLVAVPAGAKSEADTKPTADADLLELLGQELAGYLGELTKALATLAGNLADEKQWDTARRLFHTIKGTAATFNLEAVSVPAKAAEARCLQAVEAAAARQVEALEFCVQHAQMVAQALHLPFDDAAVRTALEIGSQKAAAGSPISTPESQPASLEPLPTDTAPAGGSLDAEMVGFFISDAREQIELIEKAVLRWEKGESPTEQIWAAQRGFHTLKGAGNSIGLTAVAQSVHGVEEFLEGLATSGATQSRPVFTFLLGTVDHLRNYLADLTRDSAAPWRNDWSAILSALKQPEAAAPSDTTITAAVSVAGPAPAATETADGDAYTLRIEADRLYQLMNLIGEMVIDRARLARKVEQLNSLHRTLTERNQALTGAVQMFQQQFEFNLIPGGSGTPQSEARKQKPLADGQSAGGATERDGDAEFSELEFDRYDQFNVLARTLVEISHDIEELNGDLADCLDAVAAENLQFTHTSQQLQSKVTSLSLVPVNTLFPRLQRAFRDALNVEHKEAELVLQGGSTLLDKVVVDKVYAPLLHLLRNAVAHGIEDSTTRQHRQKPACGQVRLSAAQFANQIIIQLTDDGAGVDAEAVRRRAVERGWLAADAPPLTPAQVVDYIFQPGFSTAAKVTSVSGRGIGLDVVRQEIESLNGAVELKYEPGQGSTWTLRLPLTLAISEAILADVGGTIFAFPLNFIEAGIVLDETTVDANGRECFAVKAKGQSPESPSQSPESGLETGDSDRLPVIRLAQRLHWPGNPQSRSGLILSVGDRRAIVVVDHVLDRHEIVIKQLDAVTALHPLLNGATLDPEGSVIPILNLPALLKFAESRVGISGQDACPRPPAAGSPTPAALRVLIVDDSLSVRKAQERFLKDLGCRVTTAADGVQALDRLRASEFDFVFTDLEMPRLNGYELISELRTTPAWASLPIVVVSSRSADKYITKAMNLGASTFLSKPFTQEQLRQVLAHYSHAQKV